MSGQYPRIARHNAGTRISGVGGVLRKFGEIDFLSTKQAVGSRFG